MTTNPHDVAGTYVASTYVKALTMITTHQAEATPIHPLARFVTKEAIALIVKLEPGQIKEIRCWPHVILVLGEGVSKFVSYADLPPSVEVEPPTNQDFVRWRKRWKKNEHKLAPKFWVEFYAQKFWQALSVAELYTWGQIVRVIKFALSVSAVQELRSVYLDAKYSLQPF